MVFVVSSFGNKLFKSFNHKNLFQEKFEVGSSPLFSPSLCFHNLFLFLSKILERNEREKKNNKNDQREKTLRDILTYIEERRRE
jgi:hypothetical protein